MAKEIKYNKLVRDKIPEIIRSRGKTPYIHKADDKEYFEKLKEKYLEETKEFFEDNTKEELSDVLEVTYAFRDYLAFDSELLEDLAKKEEHTKERFLRKVKKFIEYPNAKKLGSILGMIYSACDYIKISKEEVETSRQLKVAAKGKFLERIILEKVNE